MRQLTLEDIRARFAALPPLTRHATVTAIVRELARRDFWFFMTVVLENKVLQEDLHRPIARWLEPSGWTKTKKLFLMPRGHIKSNIATVAYAIWRILNNPNIRIMIGSHKFKDSSKFLRLIKNYLRSDRFRMFFPEITWAMDPVQNKPLVWNNDSILVVRAANLVENTIECSSADAVVTGRHYDLLLFDDLVTRENVRSAALIEEVRQYHEFTEALLEPGGQEIVTGTRYHFADEYGRICETPDIAELYDIIDMSAFKEVNDAAGEAYDLDYLMRHGTLIYPRRFTTAWMPEKTPGEEGKISLSRILRNSGPWFFNTQYMNRPQDPKTQPFTKEKLDEMWIDELPQVKLNYFRVCDLSTDEITKESFTAIVTGAVDPKATIYITDIIRDQRDGTAVLKELFDGQMVAPDRRPILIGMERQNYERAVESFGRYESMRRGIYLPIRKLPGAVQIRSKIERIRGLDTWVNSGTLRILRKCRNAHRLYDELLRFPMSKTLDVADAVSQIPVFMFPGRDVALMDRNQHDKLPDDIVNGITDDLIGDRRVMPRQVAMAVGASF